MTFDDRSHPKTAYRRSPIRVGGDAMVDAGFAVAKLAVAAMMVLITAEVVARAVLGMSLMVVDEFSGYLLVVMTFFGAAYSLRRGALLRIELVLDAMSGRTRAVAECLFNAAALILIGYFVFRQGVFAWSTWTRGMVAPTLSEIPLWIPQLAIPIGSLLLAVGLVLELRDSIDRALYPAARGDPSVDGPKGTR
jgi:TRAP-type C4-dicarboxylate transport system permease small subunit